MLSRRELGLLAIALVGWSLFGLSQWMHRDKGAVSTERQEQVVETLEAAGFSEVPISHAPPLSTLTGPTHAPAIVVASGSVPPTEQAPPQVFGEEPIQDGVGRVGLNIPEPKPKPNWTLRPGDLGLERWDFVARRVGRRAFIQFSGTLSGQTPQGSVTRAFVTDPGDEKGWVSSDLIPGGRYVDFELGGTTARAVDLTLHWGRYGAIGWGIGPAYAFDGKAWAVRASVRFPLK